MGYVGNTLFGVDGDGKVGSENCLLAKSNLLNREMMFLITQCFSNVMFYLCLNLDPN